MEWIIAFLGGMLGTFLGPTPSFILYGILGIIGQFIHNLFYQEYVLNILCIPCVCFSGAVASVAFLSNYRHHPISGMSATTTLRYATDRFSMMIGGLFGMIGYSVIVLLNVFSIHIDASALSIIVCGILIRKGIARSTIVTCQKVYAQTCIHYMKDHVFSLFVPVLTLSVFTSFIVIKTGNITLCFFISAISLLLLKLNKQLPVTHHITIIAGYAASTCTTIWSAIGFSVLMAILSQVIFETCRLSINYGSVSDMEALAVGGTSYIDPPAVAITMLSFLIFMIA